LGLFVFLERPALGRKALLVGKENIPYNEGGGGGGQPVRLRPNRWRKSGSDEDETSFSLDGWPDYEDIPLLLIDLDPARAVGRYREMAEFCGFVQPDTQKMAVLALEIENRHALRLLLIYEDPDALTKHLKRCLDDPEYGYGQRGDNGRTITQAWLRWVTWKRPLRLGWPLTVISNEICWTAGQLTLASFLAILISAVLSLFCSE
jgi:hypothetical protein